MTAIPGTESQRGGEAPRPAEQTGKGRRRDDPPSADWSHSREACDSPQKPPASRAKPWLKPVLLVGCCVAAVAGAIWFFDYWTHGRYVQSTNDAYLSADQVSVAAKVSGTVEEVFVKDNQEVHAGDPLVRIDDRASRAKVEQAQGVVAQAHAAMDQYEAQMREQDAAISQARATLDKDLATLAYNEGQLQRYIPLAASGAETQEKLSQWHSQRDQAAATVRQDRSTVVQAERRMVTYAAQRESAAAQAAQGEAQARQSQVDVDQSLIRASLDGRVGDRQVRVGQTAQIGSRLLTLVPVQSLYLVANFKETQIGLMREGQPATIKVDALDGRKIHGVVDSFSPATGSSFAVVPANNATGNFTKIVQRVPVRLRVEAGEEFRKVLVPGLSVEVSVDTVSEKDAAERFDKEDKQRVAFDQRPRTDPPFHDANTPHGAGR